MNKKHLGDSLDHWKGDVLARLEKVAAASDVRVLPMFTDAETWPDEDISTYAELLRRPKEMVLLATRQFRHRDREEYLRDANTAWPDDLFVDPDTGLCSIAAKPDKEHLSPSDLLVLLDGSPSRLLLIYQHRDRTSETGLLASWLERASHPDVFSSALWSGQAGLILLSRTKRRISDARVALCGFLGSQASRRVAPA